MRDVHLGDLCPGGSLSQGVFSLRGLTVRDLHLGDLCPGGGGGS